MLQRSRAVLRLLREHRALSPAGRGSVSSPGTPTRAVGGGGSPFAPPPLFTRRLQAARKCQSLTDVNVSSLTENLDWGF